MYKIEIRFVVPRKVVVQNLEVGLSRVPILLCLEVLVYYIESIPLPITLKHTLDHYSKLLSLLIYTDHLRLLFVSRSTLNLDLLLALALLY